MTTPKKDTGFDAFFRAVTSSPEFKSAVTKDWKWDTTKALEDTIRSMESDIDRAADIMRNFDKKFNTPETREQGNSQKTPGTSPLPKTGNATEDEKSPALEVLHFERKPGKPWGFEAVAGMDKLKIELTESFIKPLRFKFLVEKLRAEKSADTTSNQDQTATNANDTERENTNQTHLATDKPHTGEPEENPDEKKNELLEKLYTEYEKFKISIPTGMLLYGPPGTGKTFITKKLAEELGCGFISKNMGEFGSSYLHQTTKNIRDFFQWAKKAAENEPIILFLDEIDSLVSARTDRVDANKAEEVSQFLQEFNSLAEEAPNLIVVRHTFLSFF